MARAWSGSEGEKRSQYPHTHTHTRVLVDNSAVGTVTCNFLTRNTLQRSVQLLPPSLDSCCRGGGGGAEKLWTHYLTAVLVPFSVASFCHCLFFPWEDSTLAFKNDYKNVFRFQGTRQVALQKYTVRVIHPFTEEGYQVKWKRRALLFASLIYVDTTFRITVRL